MDGERKRCKAIMEKLKIYSKPSPVISRGRAAAQVLVTIRKRATGLPTANNKKGNCQLVKKMLQFRGSPTTTMSIGTQDTLDEEMMAEYNCQIETTTVCQSYGLNIDEDAVNIRDIREVTDTKMGTFYSNVRAMGLSTMYAKEGNDLSSRDMTPIRSSRVSKIGDINPKNIW